VIEVKRTLDPSRGSPRSWEHGEWLTGWPKAIVTCPVAGSIRTGDDVVAVSWGQ
jgi:hypothetical protein